MILNMPERRDKRKRAETEIRARGKGRRPAAQSGG
jgi:hypothetical protein